MNSRFNNPFMRHWSLSTRLRIRYNTDLQMMLVCYNYYVHGHYPSSHLCLSYYISKRNVSETGFYLRHQVKPSQLGQREIFPISGHLCHFQDGVYKSKQHNSSARAKKAFKLWRSTRIRPCTSDVSRLKSTLEKNNTPYVANLRKINFLLKLHLMEL
jgi:hypothetical protein